MKILVTKEQEELINSGAFIYHNESHSLEHRKGSTYYYLPYGFKKDSDGNWETVRFQDLPIKLQKLNEENQDKFE